MISLIISAIICLGGQASTATATHQPQRVSVVYYAPGVFEKVVRVRERQGYKLRRTDGWVAVPQCSRIGEVLTVKVGSKSLRLTVADCAQPRDYARLVRQRTVEVDYRSAQRLGVVKAGRVAGYMWKGE
jgi:hypothetical protein